MRTFTRAVAITPSDSAPIASRVEGVWVGGAGNLNVILGDDVDPVLIEGIPAGTMLWIKPKKVLATSTTATKLVALA